MRGGHRRSRELRSEDPGILHAFGSPVPEWVEGITSSCKGEAPHNRPVLPTWDLIMGEVDFGWLLEPLSCAFLCPQYTNLCICCCFSALSSHLWLMVTLWNHNFQNVLSSTALLSSCKFKSGLLRASVYLIFGLPLFLLPSTFPSMVFSRESCLLMMSPK